MKILLLVAVLICAVAVSAQQPPSTVGEQIEAMKQCGFLVGDWKGEGWMMMGPGDRRTFSQSEKVEPKLNRLVLQIEGLGKDPNGKVVHEALATVAYDSHSKGFRFRSYEMQGHYLDTDSNCQDNTLVWNMSAGPRKIRYTIKLNDKKQWFEIGEFSADGNTWQRFFEMTLDKSK
jgi:hypothetical protein